MQNNTPFSRDPTPNLTRTILSVVKEGQAYSGVERRAKSGPNQRATPSERRPTGSSRTEYNYFKGEYRPRGEQDRYYAKQRAEAAAAKAKKTTTVKEEQEYTELLETIIVAIASELNISPQTLIEEFSEQELSEGLRKKIMHGLKVAVAGGALLAGGAAGGLGMAKLSNHLRKNESPARQVERQKASKKSKSEDSYRQTGQAVSGVDNSAWTN